MITRLRTSKEAKEILIRLNSSLRLSSNAILLRYAISRSIQTNKNVINDPEAQVVNNSGFEITRSTLFGENEIVYKLLMGCENMNDDEFFPQITNMHIERGLRLMEKDYKLAGNKEKFFLNYIKKLHE